MEHRAGQKRIDGALSRLTDAPCRRPEATYVVQEVKVTDGLEARLAAIHPRTPGRHR